MGAHARKRAEMARKKAIIKEKLGEDFLRELLIDTQELSGEPKKHKEYEDARSYRARKGR